MKHELQQMHGMFSEKLATFKERCKMNSSNLLARNARKYPKNEAVICHGRRVTYQDLDQQVTCFSHALLEHGVRQGIRF